MSLLGKWVWRFFTEQNSLWARIIKSFYGKNGGLHIDGRSLGLSSPWAQIIESSKDCSAHGVEIANAIRSIVGNGRNTSFWTDLWCTRSQPLKLVFPRIFAMEKDKDCAVVDRWNPQNSSWFPAEFWCHHTRGRLGTELEEFSRVLRQTSLDEHIADRKVWLKTKDGSFSAKLLYDQLQASKSLVNLFPVHWWNSWIPLKVNFVVWKARRNKLPSSDNLVARRILQSHGLCHLCKEVPETLHHIVFSCSKVIGVWRKIWAWWGIPFPHVLDWNAILDKLGKTFKKKSLLKAFHGVCCITIWSIWNWRNKVAFAEDIEGAQGILVDIFPSIQSYSLLWFRFRSLHPEWIWSNWITDPKSIL